jgi:hypothetical protein
MAFKEGDRIRVYGFDTEDAGRVFTRKVAKVLDDSFLLLTDGGEYVNPKQCRKLVKRERQTIWVSTGLLKYLKYNNEQIELAGFDAALSVNEMPGLVPFVEARKK